MASCARNNRTKIIKIEYPYFKRQSIMFGMFFRHSVIRT